MVSRLPTVPSGSGRSSPDFPRSSVSILCLLPLPWRALCPGRSVRIPRLSIWSLIDRTTDFGVHHFLDTYIHTSERNLDNNQRIFPHADRRSAPLRRCASNDRCTRLCFSLHHYSMDRLTGAPADKRELFCHMVHARFYVVPHTSHTLVPVFFRPRQSSSMVLVVIPRHLRLLHAVSTHKRPCGWRKGKWR